MPNILKIGGKEIKLGQSEKIDLTVAKLPSSTMINIPVHVYRGKQDGPVLLLMAGMHGDEVNGIEIIRRIIRDKSMRPQKGSLVIVPILNIYGFLNYSRQVPDGKDVNRSFPGSKNGSLASRIASMFMAEIFPIIDYGVDFHTGGGNRSNFPQIRCKAGIKEHYDLAQAFDAPFILDAPLRDKSLRKQAALKGKPIIVYEGGEAERLDELAISEGIIGAKKVITYLGITAIPVEKRNKVEFFQKSSWIRANRAGIFKSFVKPGEKVERKQLLGVIADPYGTIEYKINAKTDGFIVGLSYSPVVNQGDALIHLGIENF